MSYDAGMKKRLHSKSRGRSFMVNCYHFSALCLINSFSLQLAVKEAKEFHELNTLPEGFLKPMPGTVSRDDKRVADQRKQVF